MKDSSRTKPELIEELSILKKKIKKLEKSSTAYKQGEEALQGSETKLSRLFMLSPAAISISTIPDGKFVEVNESFLRLLGYSRDEVIGKNGSDINLWVDRETRERIYRDLSTKGYFLEMENSYRSKDGSILTGLASGHIINISGRDYLIAMTLDITERMQAQKALQESETRYRTLVDNANDIVYKTDIAGHFTFLNPVALRLTGYPEEELIGKHYRKLIHPDRRKEVIKLLVSQLENKVQNEYYEFPIITKDGHEIWLGQNVQLVVEDGHASGFQAVARDITERKRAQEALLESQSQYRLLSDHMRDALWLMDMNLNTTYRTPSAYKQRGYTLTEYLELPFDRNLTPASFALASEVFAEAIPMVLADTTYAFVRTLELEFSCKDGTTIWTESKFSLIRDESGKPLYFLCEAHDITERKQAEDELRQSEEKYRSILENIEDGFYEVDLAGNFTFFNDSMCRILGYPQEEMMGINNRQFTDKENAKKLFKTFNKVYITGQPAKEFDWQIVRKDGTKRYIEVSVTLQKNSSGKSIGFQGISRDITERKQAEEEKAKLEGQLQQAQKMESVGRLAGGVAHDFNNMLGVIIGHTELALMKTDPAQSIHADLTEIRKAAERSADLTRQLLAFARKQTVAPKVLDLNEIVAGMLKMLRRLIGEDINLRWQPQADLWPVKMDPSQIDQILANLCVNARDAISGVGKMTIETGNSTLDKEYSAEHAGFVPGEYVRIAVSDNGCGMDKETLAHIFEPFYSTKGVGEGTGLGLATVYGAIKQNNGFINTYSEQGQGTTFTIYLPRYVGKAELLRTKGYAQVVSRGQETILLVEDEPTILEVTTTMLEMQGYTVLAAGTPGEAIRLAREHIGEINLLMTDVVMPEMNGRDLAKNLLSLYPQLKRLFMSGYTANVIAHHGVLDEGVYFIQKPFSIKEMAAKVREALDSK